MWKKLIIILIAATATCYGLLSPEKHTVPNKPAFETFLPSALRESIPWKIVESTVTEQGFGLKEWIPEDQSIKNWSDKFCVQYIPYDSDTKKNARVLFREIHDKKKKKFLNWDILEMQDGSVLYETMDSRLKKFRQEFTRIITTDDGYYLISFKRLDEPVTESQHAYWTQLLKDIKVK
ncbi:MAG: hypothetical protein JHC93_07140 [Parachlamydiales bacterium]|nr:hypothetical protein [Parachlamydiales bacterium]